MRVEIISVGTELLMGEIVNTNANDLMKFCKNMGFDVYYETTVGDNPKRLEEVITLAFERGADTVITSGGIGPTNDDLTKEISAKVLGLEMVYLEQEAIKISKKVGFLNRSMDHIAKSNYKQAYYAKGAYILENEVGTANACVIEKDGRRIINLPGPPIELKYVIENSLKPYFMQYVLEQLYTKEYVVLKTGESQLADELAPLFTMQDEVTLALYAGQGYVRIRLATKQASEIKAKQLLQDWENKLVTILGQRLSSIDALAYTWLNMLPSFKIVFKDCEFLKSIFYTSKLIDKICEDSNNQLVVSVIQEEMGEVVVLEAYFEQQYFKREIPCLKQAMLHQEKLQQRLYTFLEDASKELKQYEA